MRFFRRIMPPGFGQTQFYLCQSCGKSFPAKLPLFPLFRRLKCPKCGSDKVILDIRIQH